VTGSLGFALQGFPITPNDIDLQTTGPGAYEMARVLGLKVTKPVFFKEGERIRSDFGQFLFDELEIEVMGDVNHCRADGTWGSPPNLTELLHWVQFEELRIPVLPLEYEIEAYKRMGRDERADSLRKWLVENGRT
jgi:hypothetical protein